MSADFSEVSSTNGSQSSWNSDDFSADSGSFRRRGYSARLRLEQSFTPSSSSWSAATGTTGTTGTSRTFATNTTSGTYGTYGTWATAGTSITSVPSATSQTTRTSGTSGTLGTKESERTPFNSYNGSTDDSSLRRKGSKVRWNISGEPFSDAALNTAQDALQWSNLNVEGPMGSLQVFPHDETNMLSDGERSANDDVDDTLQESPSKKTNDFENQVTDRLGTHEETAAVQNHSGDNTEQTPLVTFHPSSQNPNQKDLVEQISCLNKGRKSTKRCVPTTEENIAPLNEHKEVEPLEEISAHQRDDHEVQSYEEKDIELRDSLEETGFGVDPNGRTTSSDVVDQLALLEKKASALIADSTADGSLGSSDVADQLALLDKKSSALIADNTADESLGCAVEPVQLNLQDGSVMCPSGGNQTKESQAEEAEQEVDMPNPGDTIEAQIIDSPLSLLSSETESVGLCEKQNEEKKEKTSSNRHSRLLPHLKIKRYLPGRDKNSREKMEQKRDLYDEDAESIDGALDRESDKELQKKTVLLRTIMTRVLHAAPRSHRKAHKNERENDTISYEAQNGELVSQSPEMAATLEERDATDSECKEKTEIISLQSLQDASEGIDLVTNDDAPLADTRGDHNNSTRVPDDEEVVMNPTTEENNVLTQARAEDKNISPNQSGEEEKNTGITDKLETSEAPTTVPVDMQSIGGGSSHSHKQLLHDIAHQSSDKMFFSASGESWGSRRILEAVTENSRFSENFVSDAGSRSVFDDSLNAVEYASAGSEARGIFEGSRSALEYTSSASATRSNLDDSPSFVDYSSFASGAFFGSSQKSVQGAWENFDRIFCGCSSSEKNRYSINALRCGNISIQVVRKDSSRGAKAQATAEVVKEDTRDVKLDESRHSQHTTQEIATPSPLTDSPPSEALTKTPDECSEAPSLTKTKDVQEDVSTVEAEKMCPLLVQKGEAFEGGQSKPSSLGITKLNLTTTKDANLMLNKMSRVLKPGDTHDSADEVQKMMSGLSLDQLLKLQGTVHQHQAKDMARSSRRKASQGGKRRRRSKRSLRTRNITSDELRKSVTSKSSNKEQSSTSGRDGSDHDSQTADAALQLQTGATQTTERGSDDASTQSGSVFSLENLQKIACYSHENGLAACSVQGSSFEMAPTYQNSAISVAEKNADFESTVPLEMGDTTYRSSFGRKVARLSTLENDSQPLDQLDSIPETSPNPAYEQKQNDGAASPALSMSSVDVGHSSIRASNSSTEQNKSNESPGRSRTDTTEQNRSAAETENSPLLNNVLSSALLNRATETIDKEISPDVASPDEVSLAGKNNSTSSVGSGQKDSLSSGVKSESSGLTSISGGTISLIGKMNEVMSLHTTQAGELSTNGESVRDMASVFSLSQLKKLRTMVCRPEQYGLAAVSDSEEAPKIDFSGLEIFACEASEATKEMEKVERSEEETEEQKSPETPSVNLGDGTELLGIGNSSSRDNAGKVKEAPTEQQSKSLNDSALGALPETTESAPFEGSVTKQVSLATLDESKIEETVKRTCSSQSKESKKKIEQQQGEILLETASVASSKYGSASICSETLESGTDYLAQPVLEGINEKGSFDYVEQSDCATLAPLEIIGALCAGSACFTAWKSLSERFRKESKPSESVDSREVPTYTNDAQTTTRNEEGRTYSPSDESLTSLVDVESSVVDGGDKASSEQNDFGYNNIEQGNKETSFFNEMMQNDTLTWCGKGGMEERTCSGLVTSLGESVMQTTLPEAEKSSLSVKISSDHTDEDTSCETKEMSKGPSKQSGKSGQDESYEPYDPSSSSQKSDESIHQAPTVPTRSTAMVSAFLENSRTRSWPSSLDDTSNDVKQGGSASTVYSYRNKQYVKQVKRRKGASPPEIPGLKKTKQLRQRSISPAPGSRRKAHFFNGSRGKKSEQKQKVEAKGVGKKEDEKAEDNSERQYEYFGNRYVSKVKQRRGNWKRSTAE